MTVCPFPFLSLFVPIFLRLSCQRLGYFGLICSGNHSTAFALSFRGGGRSSGTSHVPAPTTYAQPSQNSYAPSQVCEWHFTSYNSYSLFECLTVNIFWLISTAMKSSAGSIIHEFYCCVAYVFIWGFPLGGS